MYGFILGLILVIITWRHLACRLISPAGLVCSCPEVDRFFGQVKKHRLTYKYVWTFHILSTSGWWHIYIIIYILHMYMYIYIYIIIIIVIILYYIILYYIIYYIILYIILYFILYYYIHAHIYLYTFTYIYIGIGWVTNHFPSLLLWISQGIQTSH